MKKSSIVIATLIASSISTVTAFAATDKVNSVEVSLNHYNYSYEERQGSYVPDSEKAWMNGAHLSYKSQDSNTKEYWEVRYDKTNQNTHYDGHYLVSGLPVQSTTENRISDFQVVYAVPINDKKNQYVYAGIGNRNWKRSLSANQNETYEWSYIPVGYRNEFKINKKVDGAVDVSAKFMFDGTMKAEEDNMKFTLGNKPGFRAEVPITYKMDTEWALKLTPWYEFSAIGRSNVVGGYYEPDSVTHQYGVNVGVQYSF